MASLANSYLTEQKEGGQSNCRIQISCDRFFHLRSHQSNFSGLPSRPPPSSHPFVPAAQLEAACLIKYPDIPDSHILPIPCTTVHHHPYYPTKPGSIFEGTSIDQLIIDTCPIYKHTSLPILSLSFLHFKIYLSVDNSIITWPLCDGWSWSG